MKLMIPGIIALAVATVGSAWGQNPYTPGQNVPLYRVTVIERTVKAVNYQYRSGPTQIDFRGTVLLPEAKGDATVESKAGRTEIDARFDRVLAPARYGHEYLTYVLWAITPEGHAKNLGEVLAGSSDKAKLHVTTDLQAFGLIVTAEPYAAVRQPSDVVVMENEIRPDTMGKIEPIQAKYELLPRGEYTYDVPADLVAAEGNGPRVSMSVYEETMEVYQAQNAVQIAGAMGAAQYAPDTFGKAQALLHTAQNLQASRADKGQVISEAREAAQTAEDARLITLKRMHDAEVAEANSRAEQERQSRLQAQAQAQAAQAQASADRAMLDQERNARRQAEAQAQAAQAEASADRTMLQQAETQAAVSAQIPPPPPPQDTQRRDLRMSLYRQLGASSLEIMDTPRGLVVTIPAGDFTGRSLQPFAAGRVARVAAAIAVYPGLTVEVDDNFDGGRAERAEAVRAALIGSGMPAGAISVRSVGNSRPIASTTTAEGRELNRRVEIAIFGDAIGNMPYWDRTYSITPR
ncbi:MAG: OmpA family protein [Bryobacteraceae bacterium]